MALTEDEIEHLREASSKRGMGAWETDVAPDPDDQLEFPWREMPRDRVVTQERCNAVRCAAHDGKSFAEIADLYGFISSPERARFHARGECSHAGVEPFTDRSPGPPNEVTPADCSRIRRLCARSDLTYSEVGRKLGGLSKSAVWRHANAECSHGLSERNP